MFSIQEYLKDLTYLCSIDSGNRNAEGTKAMAAFFKERYEALGLKTEIRYYNDNDFAPFLLARNSDSEKIDVLFIAHMDTVFPVGHGKERPLTVDAENIGRGPGIIDCKGGCLLVESLLKEMRNADGTWKFNFAVAYNSDEERGSKFSRAYFEELAQKSKYCFVFEPGRANDEFVSVRKGGANYILHCHGIAAHSGVEPEKGASAILELSKWVSELYELVDYAAGTTLNIGRFDGGGDNGAVPDYAECTLSFRYLDPKALEGLKAKLAYMQEHRFDMRTTIEVEQVSLRPAMIIHPATAALIDELEAAGKETDQPITHLTTGGGSDGNFVSPYGVATLDGCGPCGANLHTVNEYLKVGSVEKRLVLMQTLLNRLFK